MLMLILLGCLAIVQCAPTEQLTIKDAAMQQEIKALHPLREYLILTPEAQLQLQPALKLQQPVIQPLALYGTAASSRQFENICNQIQQGVGSFQEVIPFPLPWFQTDDDNNAKKLNAEQRVPEINTDAETIPQGMLPRTPAATVPAPEHRFYTISGRPQFFGNVDILQNPLHPIFSLQPLQPLKARNMVEPLNNAGQEEKTPILLVQSNSEALPLALPLQGNQAALKEQTQVAEDAARSFVKALEEKQIENLKKQGIEQTASNLVAQKFASQFDAEKLVEHIKEEDALSIVLDNSNLIKAAKSVESVESGELPQLANQDAQPIEEKTDLEQQQQVKLAESDKKFESIEK